jgi:hypothetical protein
MVRSQALPFGNYADATPGQLTWVWLNQLADYDERVARIHVHCLPKFRKEYCEVCHDPIIAIEELPEEIQNRVYKPAPHETYDVKLGTEEIFKPGEVRVVDEFEVELE